MADKFNPAEHDLKESLIALNRVSKTVKGGRIARFAALMVVGDGAGHVGVGLGKAAEVPEAIRKGIEDAKKNMVAVALKGTTIPHQVTGVFGAGKVLLKPAAPGTGIIAGGKVRMVLEAAGIKNIRAKCLRSNNPTNVVKATMEGLKELRTAEEVAKIRDIPTEQVKG
jgi:small subunit ribosomal protein S5